MTHTPGPWRAAVEDDDDQRAGEFELACLEHPIWGIGIYAPGWYSDDHAEHVANAHLIAAAPDLLAAAKFAIKQLQKLNFTPSAGGIVARLGTAISKAEGR